MKTANNWEWAVNWLKSKMVDSFGNTSNYVSWNTKPQSNDDSETRTFQRTKSAQVNVNLIGRIYYNYYFIFKRTLDDATALLSKSNELDD